MLAQQLAGAGIKQSHVHRVPLHVDLPTDPARRRAIVSRLYFDATIQMNRALAILVVAERLQRQRLQEGLLFGEHRGNLPLGPPMDALIGPALFPVVQIRLRFFQALELLALQRRLLRMADATLDFSFSIRIPHFARQRRHAVMRQNVTIQGIQTGIVEVGRQHALAKVVQDHDPRRTAQPAKGLLMQLGPHPRTRSEDQQANRLAAAAQRHDKQPRASIFAAVRIAHHRPGPVINLGLFTWLCLDDHPRFSRYRSAQLAHESLDTLIAAGKPMPIDQILPDTHRVAAALQLQHDQLPVCFTGSGMDAAPTRSGDLIPAKSR